MSVDLEIRQAVKKYLERELKAVYIGNFDKCVEDSLSERRIEEQIELLSSFVKDLREKSLLEIGVVGAFLLP
jgi:predicted O-methyltransferase YrrM